MTDKEIFIDEMQKRTRKLLVDVIIFCGSLKKCKASDVITYQLVKAATSVGANYRAACRARSKAEFFSKICVVVEEADESEYWFEVISEAGLSPDKAVLSRLATEANELTKIMTKAKNSTYPKASHNVQQNLNI